MTDEHICWGSILKTDTVTQKIWFTDQKTQLHCKLSFKIYKDRIKKKNNQLSFTLSDEKNRVALEAFFSFLCARLLQIKRARGAKIKTEAL